MLNRTHFTFALFLVLVFLPLINFKFSFIFIALIFSLIPDVDVKTSFIGKYKFFLPLQFFVNHRGFFHSFLFMILGIVFFLFFYPIGAFAFFVGYCSHLILDSFTIEGVRLFYPLKSNFSWKLKTGSSVERLIFISFIVLDFFMLIFLLFD